MSVLPRATRSRKKARRRRTYLAAADRRAQILEVAKDVFARRSYHAANIAEICDGARIARGTLYQYFDNKHDLLLAVLESVAARIADVLARRPRVAQLPDVRRAPVALIVRFCRHRLREMLDAVFLDEATLRLILREARGLDGVVDRLIRTIDDLVLDAMEQDLRAAQSAGVFRRGDPRLIARYLLGGVEKMVLHALADDEPIDLDKIVEQSVDIELFGLLSHEVKR